MVGGATWLLVASKVVEFVTRVLNFSPVGATNNVVVIASVIGLVLVKSPFVPSF